MFANKCNYPCYEQASDSEQRHFSHPHHQMNAKESVADIGQ